MPASPADLYDILKKIRYDTTAIQARITDAMNLLNALEIPDKPATKCEHCTLQLRGPRTLAEHVYQMHNGPLPDHWQEDAA